MTDRFARLGFAVLAAFAVTGCGGGGGTAQAPIIFPTPTPGGPGSVPITANSTYTTPTTLSGDTLQIAFGNAVPPGEWIDYVGVTPPGVLVPASFFTGAAFTIGPWGIPVSAISGVTLVPGVPQPSSFAADLYQNTPSFAHASPPFRVAPATAYQPGTDSNPTLTLLSPNALYSIAIFRT
jgi:hypothetical protein